MVIYLTINLIDFKFYIGKDKNNNEKYLGSGKILKNAVKKHGKDNFTKVIIEKCKTEFELSDREIYWIDFFEATKYGYNIAKGGEGGDTITNHPNKQILAKNHSDKMKLKKYNNRIGEKFGELSDEVKEKIRNSLIGTSWGNHTKEAKDKIALKAKGRVVSDETRKNMSDNKLGVKLGPMSDETKEKIRNTKMGELNPMYGKTHSDEVKKFLRILNQKPKEEDTKAKISRSLIEYYKLGNKPINTKRLYIDGEIFEGYREASEYLGIPISTIRNRIKSISFPEYKHI